nr:chloride channel protein [Clostridia bacterium]
SRTERRILMAGGASAGLAAAFNAPLAGAVFAVEEIFRYLSPVLLLTIMVSTVSADFVSKLIFGLSPVFSFATPASIPLSDYWMLVVLGIVMGCAGALYNAVLLKTQALYRAQKWLPARMRPVVPFLLAGALGLIFPTVLGGGHAVLEHLRATTPMGMLGMILVVKFLFSMISFGSGAPGGIFFPLLILGATLGALAGNAATAYLGVDTALLNDFIVVAMAGLFSAIVRAPITGVILLLEMTGSFVNLLPLITVSLVAYVVADALKSKPIYDSLLENLLGHATEKPDCREKITVERIVQHGSQAAGRQVRELGFPKDCLLIAIRRDAEEIIPSGSTQIHPGDYLVFLLNRRDEADSRQRLDALTSAE